MLSFYSLRAASQKSAPSDTIGHMSSRGAGMVKIADSTKVQESATWLPRWPFPATISPEILEGLSKILLRFSRRPFGMFFTGS
jgi:hypothetical protein